MPSSQLQVGETPLFEAAASGNVSAPGLEMFRSRWRVFGARGGVSLHLPKANRPFPSSSGLLCFFPFLWEGFLLKSTSQKGCRFFFSLATGHLSLTFWLWVTEFVLRRLFLDGLARGPLGADMLVVSFCSVTGPYALFSLF